MKGMSKPIIAADKDPNICFVLFSSVYFDAANVEAGLASLLTQVQQVEGERL